MILPANKFLYRVWIALLGVSTAGLSLASGIGLSASITFEWSVLHLIGPFLIIGIGVDDMFILLQSWNTIDNDPNLKHRPVYEKAGFVLKVFDLNNNCYRPYRQ